MRIIMFFQFSLQMYVDDLNALINKVCQFMLFLQNTAVIENAFCIIRTTGHCFLGIWTGSVFLIAIARS